MGNLSDSVGHFYAMRALRWVTVALIPTYRSRASHPSLFLNLTCSWKQSLCEKFYQGIQRPTSGLP